MDSLIYSGLLWVGWFGPTIIFYSEPTYSEKVLSYFSYLCRINYEIQMNWNFFGSSMVDTVLNRIESLKGLVVWLQQAA